MNRRTSVLPLVVVAAILSGCQMTEEISNYKPYVLTTLDESARRLDDIAKTRTGSDADTLRDFAVGVRAVRTTVKGIGAGGEYDSAAVMAALYEIAAGLDEIANRGDDKHKLVLCLLASGLRMAASRAGGLE